MIDPNLLDPIIQIGPGIKIGQGITIGANGTRQLLDFITQTTDQFFETESGANTFILEQE